MKTLILVTIACSLIGCSTFKNDASNLDWGEKLIQTITIEKVRTDEKKKG